MSVKSLLGAVLLVAIPAVSFWASEQRSQAADGRAPAGEDRPARVEPVPGTDLRRVVLLPRAAERLGIETAPVGAGSPAAVRLASDAGTGAAARTVVPYSAVLYDTQGAAWVYTNPEPLVFVRARVRVGSINGDQAVLTDGPPAGTIIVTVGGAELLAAELGN